MTSCGYYLEALSTSCLYFDSADHADVETEACQAAAKPY
jgi:hypothetical protein